MAMETCFQVSTIAPPTRTAAAAATRACAAHAHDIPHHKEKLQLPTRKAPRAAAFSLSTSSPIAPSPSRSRRGRGGRLVCEAAKNAVAEVMDVTEATWSKLVTESDKVVLVDFWAPWCGPCRMISPVMDELAKEYAGRVACLKLNTDECRGVANRLGIRSIPTVLFFKGGEKKESVIGAVPRSTLAAAIDKYLEL